MSPMSGLDHSRIAQALGPLLRGAVRDGIAAAKGQTRAKATTVAGDLVTDADYAIQNRLQTALTALVPGSSFIGEEDFTARDAVDDSPHWIVDPLDGTLNFASGLPFFGASVALLVERRPVVGVIYDHGADCLYDATAGGGARCDGVPFVWDAALAARAPAGISSGYLAHSAPADALSGAAAIVGPRFRIFGSQAIQLCWAAAGRLRLNLNYEAKLWDDAAGWLICREAGAGYAALGSDPLFPLVPGAPALAGGNLISVSGSPDLVTRYRTLHHEGS